MMQLKLRIILVMSLSCQVVSYDCLEFCGQSSSKSETPSANHKPVQVKESPITRHKREVRPFSVWEELELLFATYQLQHQYKDFQQNQSPDQENFAHQAEAPSTFDVDGRDGYQLEPRVSSGQTSNQLAELQEQLPAVSGAAPQDPSLKVIETAVFIDQALDSKFTGLSNGLVELNKLVLTIMNQVQYLFEYSSLQVPIKLKLVLVEHLRESERLVGSAAPNSERGDIDAYLSNFCNWQHSRLNREKRLWWDHAILLSG